MGHHEKGFYMQYQVERLDGRDQPGEKHYGCIYFVLDLNHDPHALPVLRAYRDACQNENPALAAGLDDLIVKMEQNIPIEVILD